MIKFYINKTPPLLFFILFPIISFMFGLNYHKNEQTNPNPGDSPG